MGVSHLSIRIALDCRTANNAVVRNTLQQQDILKVRAKAKTPRAKVKAWARANTFLARDPGMCRFLIQRDIQRRIGVRGTAN